MGQPAKAPRTRPLLRGFASSCPQEREGPLAGLYGAVHHQGDVYDSTLARVPSHYDLMGRAGPRGRGATACIRTACDGPDAELLVGPAEPLCLAQHGPHLR
ncbi:hypothetical protein [Streptomyces sp. NPDC001020]